MSIAKFNTVVPNVPAIETGGTGSGSSKTIITLLVLAAIGFIAYKFVYLPMKARKEAEQNQED